MRSPQLTEPQSPPRRLQRRFLARNRERISLRGMPRKRQRWRVLWVLRSLLALRLRLLLRYEVGAASWADPSPRYRRTYALQCLLDAPAFRLREAPVHLVDIGL